MPDTEPQDPMAAALEKMPPASTRQGAPGHDSASELGNAIRALTMRIGRASYAQIAQELGYSDPATARNLVMRALARREAEQVEELRAVENAALDADELELRLIIGTRSNPTQERLRAIDVRTRLSARRSRLNGMDAPVQVQISSGVRQELDSALQRAREVILGEVIEVHDEPMSEALEG